MRLIDADEAIINFGFEWDDISPTRDEFVEFIKKQPTIEAVPIRWGHWIDGADSFGAKRGKYRVCSFCNICIPRTKEVPDAYWQCCPNCGSKMHVDRKEGADNG